ncbi:Palmitoyltransferase [Aix galericulata]|nr:Palmitoyltransferase [Aix galericulata]
MAGGAGPACKNHCHGPHRPHMHNCHSIHSEKDLPVLPGSHPIVEDPSSFDIVKATQYGILERCKELVEAGYDVRQPDKENVTLLHWAAINNRQELVKYYISKGAVVDQLGGDLNSTPLHWAIRQGHLPMVILLLKCGADPSLIDGEGFTSIHLAVLFQHMPIIAYLISKGQNIDTTDLNGQTPLMLSAQKVMGQEPTKFLLKFNPSLNAVDNVQKNTALHWAITSGNISAVDLLLEAGASMDIKNVKGETPLDLAIQTQDRFIVYMLTEEERMRSRRNSRLLRIMEKHELFLLVVSSLTLVWAIGYIMNLSSDSWLLKGCLLLFLLLGTALFVRQFVGLKNLRTWRTDPGYIKSSEEEKKEIAFLGLTSHERMNLLMQSKSSKHPVSLRRTSYNLGCFQNLADFFQCTCFGMFKPNIVDWTKQYKLFHLVKEKNVHSV